MYLKWGRAWPTRSTKPSVQVLATAGLRLLYLPLCVLANKLL